MRQQESDRQRSGRGAVMKIDTKDFEIHTKRGRGAGEEL